MSKRIIITESQLKYIIENIDRINEQTDNDTYGIYNFGQNFEANYIDPLKDTAYWNEIKRMSDDLKKAISEGKKLVDIKMDIISSASKLPATQRYAGANPPNHDYGGLLKKYSPNGWVKRKTDTDPAPIAIIGGNKFLAENRGVETKKALIEDLKKYGIEIPENNINVKWSVSESNDAKEQYVRVEIKGLLKDIPPVPETESKWTIDYHWYQMSGDDSIYIILHSGMSGKAGRGQLNAYGYDSEDNQKVIDFKNSVDSLGNDVTVAVIFEQGKEGGIHGRKYNPAAYLKITGWDKRNGSKIYFNNEDSWKKAVVLMEKYSDKIGAPYSRATVKTWGPNSHKRNIKIDGVTVRSSSGYYEEGKGGYADYTASQGEGSYGPHGKAKVYKHPTVPQGEYIIVKAPNQVKASEPSTEKTPTQSKPSIR